MGVMFSSFLYGGLQRIVVKGEISKWFPVDSGFPQGSVLGPSLFILYVNYIPDLINSKVKMFADNNLSRFIHRKQVSLMPYLSRMIWINFVDGPGNGYGTLILLSVNT